MKLENLILTEESEPMDKALVHTILSVIVRYGEGFKHWKEDLGKDVPKSLETISS
jgi:hypothetical protein